jgi:hypothetical protein
MMPDIEMIPVVSSNIDSIGYDVDTQMLRVQFNNGSVYEYMNVPAMEFEQLNSAPSVGAYLNRNIKGNYTYQKAG